MAERELTEYGSRLMGKTLLEFNGLGQIPVSEDTAYVLGEAKLEADRFGNASVNTEHLLLALIKKQDADTTAILNALGVHFVSKIAHFTEYIISQDKNPEKSKSQKPQLAPQGKAVLEKANNERRRLEEAQVEPKHILLGLAREEESIAGGVLESLGLSSQRLRETAKNLTDIERQKMEKQLQVFQQFLENPLVPQSTKDSITTLIANLQNPQKS